MTYRDIGAILLKDETGAAVRAISMTAHDNPIDAVRMKSTKVQNPRRISRIKPIMRGYWPRLVV